MPSSVLGKHLHTQLHTLMHAHAYTCMHIHACIYMHVHINNQLKCVSMVKVTPTPAVQTAAEENSVGLLSL